jgi:hypothetical protein
MNRGRRWLGPPVADSQRLEIFAEHPQPLALRIGRWAGVNPAAKAFAISCPILRLASGLPLGSWGGARHEKNLATAD